MTNEVNTAQNTLAELEEKRARLIEHGFRLSDQRREISYDAHAIGDESARKKLAKLHGEIVQHDSEVQSIEEAIEIAKLKLAQAHGAVNAEKDRADALEQRQVLAAFADCLKEIDDALKALVDKSKLSVELLRSMRQYGWAPTDQMWDVNLRMIIQTATAQTPVRSAFPPIAPHERRTAFQYLTGIGSNSGLLHIIGSRIAQRLGEDEQTEKAA
jgi:hypothetical protein